MPSLDQLEIRYSRFVYPGIPLTPDRRPPPAPRPRPQLAIVRSAPVTPLAPPKPPKPPKIRVYRKPTPRSRRAKSETNAKLRDLKLANGICINGRLDGQPGRNGVVHGPVISVSGKCQHCVDVHKKSRGLSGKQRARAA